MTALPDDTSVRKDAVIAALRTVHDPEIPVNIYDLGLIYDLEVGADGSVAIRMTLTTPNCPVAESLPEQIRAKAGSVDGVTSATVEVVWEPPWTGEMMSADAKLQLEMMGISWSDPTPPGGRSTSLTIGGKRQPDARTPPRDSDLSAP